MKIRVVETEIEADARELRESNTLAGNVAQMLSRCFRQSFRSTEPFDDDEEQDEEGEHDAV